MRRLSCLSLSFLIFSACGGTSPTKGSLGGQADGGVGAGGTGGQRDAGSAGGGPAMDGTADGPTVTLTCTNSGAGAPVVDTCNPQSGSRVVEWGSMTQFEAPPVAIAVGGFFGAIKQDGTVAVWGTLNASQFPPPGLTNVKALAIGGWHALALTNDGTVVAWGDNSYHQVDVPAALSSTKVKAIAAGDYFSLAVTETNQIVAWGDDRHGQVSDLQTDTAVQSALAGATILAVGATGFTSDSDRWDLGFALKDDGRVVSWGEKYSPNSTTTFHDSDTLAKKVVAFAGGDQHAMALYEDGTVGHWGRCWREECSLPETILTDVVGVAAGGANFEGFSVALKRDGTLVSTGATSPNGVSAYGSAVYNKVPPILTNIKSIAGGSKGLLALGNDGSLYVWGFRSDPRSSSGGPISQVEKLRTTPTPCIATVAAGSAHTLALKTDGTVVGWGDNSLGQLDIPQGLDKVKAIAVGGDLSLALRTDGTVVQWGNVSKLPAGACDLDQISAWDGGVLAHRLDGAWVWWGSLDSHVAAVPASGGPITALAVSYNQALATRPDGTLLTWGMPGLTLPAAIASAPVLALALGYEMALVIEQDRTAFAWEISSLSALPTEGSAIAALSPAKAIAASSSHCGAIKTDGSLVVLVSHPSPTSEAVLSDPGPFDSLSMGPDHIIALRAKP
jgi:alpha-tubulin suppressor-like RCC1 family protein